MDTRQPQLPGLDCCSFPHSSTCPCAQNSFTCNSCCCHVEFAHLRSDSARPCAHTRTRIHTLPRPRPCPCHLHVPFCVAKYMCRSVPNDTLRVGVGVCALVVVKNHKKFYIKSMCMNIFGECAKNVLGEEAHSEYSLKKT